MQGKKIFKTNQTNELIEYLCNEIMSEDEKKLMKLVFCHDPSQEDLDNILKGWNIEEKGINKILLLAYFMKRHPNLKFTTDYEFKIKNLLLNYRFKNIQTITHYWNCTRNIKRRSNEILETRFAKANGRYRYSCKRKRMDKICRNRKTTGLLV